MKNKSTIVFCLAMLIICVAWVFLVSAQAGQTQKSPEELYSEGVKYKEKGMLDNAIEVFKQGIAICPACPAYYSQIGEIYIDRENFEQAIPYLLKALKKYSAIPVTPTEQFVSLHIALVHAYSGIGHKHYYSKEVCLREIYHVVKALELDPNFRSKDLCILMINSALRYLESIERGEKVIEAGGDGKEFILPEDNISFGKKLEYKDKAKQLFRDYQEEQLQILKTREERQDLRRGNE